MKIFLIFLCAFLLVFSVVGIAGANLIINGDFEAGLSGWSSADVTVIPDGVGGHAAKFNDDNDWNSTARLKQGFNIPEGTKSIKIGFDYWFKDNEIETCDGDWKTDWFKSSLIFETENFPWLNYNVLTYDTNDTGITHFSASYDLTGLTNFLGPSNAWLKFILYENSGRCQDCTDSEAYLDNVTAGPVYEPATMLLLGVGLIGLAGVGRKKFRKS